MKQEWAVSAVQVADVDALYRYYARPLYAFIYSKVGNREAAEDLTSDVFMKALTHLDLTREDHSIVAWLFRVARNVVTDYWRTAGRVGYIIPFEEAVLERQGAYGLGPSALERARQQQAAARASALLDHLPVMYRTVLSYRLLEGLSLAETARRMDITAAYVKVLQYRALKRAAKQREEAPAEAGHRGLDASAG